MRFHCSLVLILSLACAAGSPASCQERQDQSAAAPSSPMAVPATPESLERFVSQYEQSPFLTIPESRERPIRLFDGIPELWTRRTPAELTSFTASPRPGEYFTFQIGVYAHRKELRGLQVTWSSTGGSPALSTKDITCFNTSGVNDRGERFQKSLTVPRGRVQPLWFGVQIPINATGNYQTQVTIAAADANPVTVDVRLNVAGTPVKNSGFDSGKTLSRLAWLNSTLGEDSAVTKGYKPLRRSGKDLTILGRKVTIGTDGLPARILSYFEPSNQFLLTQGEPLLARPFRFVIEKEDGTGVLLSPGALEFSGQTPSEVSWRVRSSSVECDLTCTGTMEFDGFVDYKLTLVAKRSANIRDIRLEVPVRAEKSTYMMGLNHEGGIRPPRWSWKWDLSKNQDMLWVGAVNGGIRIKWTAENYVRPLINVYYAFGPLHLPPSWGNEGKGGVNLTETGDTVKIAAYSGARSIRRGDTLHYNFELQITPSRVIDKVARFNDRYYQGATLFTGRKLGMAHRAGANIVNIHHAEDLYPFINYPYLDENVEALKHLVDSAHAQGQRLKLYYTTRELTKNLPEFWAFFSLDGEVIYPGPGDSCRTIINPNGPNQWLKKNLKERYIPAWLNVIKEGPFTGELDLSVITTPDSRLNNFYIGGLDWMLKNLGIDGVYIDDSALDRLTVRRARKLIDHYRPAGRIDFHTWNHFNAMAGWANCLNLYMDLLPYFDLVWVGEMRDYDRMPDHWLIEVSGIPYGLTGQMLQNDGNPWRGMVYAITNRPGWAAGNPQPLWNFWDAHQFQEKQMVGYWDRNTPVTCANDSLRVTLYKGKKESILAVANWGRTPQMGTIEVDWTKLGYNPSTCVITIPPIPEFQEGRSLASLRRITVPAKKGYLIVLRSGKP
jgi:hypothetical protein